MRIVYAENERRKMDVSRRFEKRYVVEKTTTLGSFIYVYNLLMTCNNCCSICHF